MTDTLILKLPGRPEYIGTVRMFFSGIAARAGFSVMQIEDIKTAVSEGCTLLLRTKPENIDIDVLRRKTCFRGYGRRRVFGYAY